jgi:hypothetical protein
MTFALVISVLVISVVLNILLLIIGVKMAADFTAFNAALAKLQTDVATLVSRQPNDQPAIDAATAAVNALDNSVVAATPPAPVTPAA